MTGLPGFRTLPAVERQRLEAASAVLDVERGTRLFRESSGLAAQFTDFECWGNTGRTKSENLRSVIERNRLRRPVFVGDTEGDQRAAIDNGVPFVHAAYGFGAVQGEDLRLETFADLVALFG